MNSIKTVVASSSIGPIAKNAVDWIRNLRDNDRTLKGEFYKDYCTLIERGNSSSLPPDGHLLIASTGNRNTGDQAMLEAFLYATSEPVTVVVHGSSSYSVPPPDRDRVTIVPLPFLLYGRGRNHDLNICTLAILMRQHRTFSIIGADIIDGGYQRRSAVLSWSCAYAASKLGLDSRVLGFSWNTNVDPLIVRFAKTAAQAGTRLIARDPHSYERLSEEGVSPVINGADTVFTLPSSSTKPSLPFAISEAPLALINVSGLIRSRLNLLEDYTEIVHSLATYGYQVVLVPMVDNPAGSDIRAIDEVHVTCKGYGPSLQTIDRLLLPAEIRWLCQRASVIITGRMHLAVIGLSSGTPTILLSTQGKATGLMELIGLPKWALSPVSGFAQEAKKRVDQLEANRAEIQGQILERLPKIVSKAKLSYDGLE